ncbi:hypothetical protein MCOR25_009027 [Pyricularia grisea]|nr:hypothetical protein MCOR25_009027 [Pyricularia grisea]
MGYLANTLLALLCLLLSAYSWHLARNIAQAKRLKLPCLVVPVDQSSLVWMLAMMPLRPLVERVLPTRAYRRLKLATFDWEWHEKRKPFEDCAAPTFVLAGCGSLLEVWTCDALIAADVLSNPAEFHVSKLGTALLGAIGPNVMSTNGKEWSIQRKLLQQVINERISKSTFGEAVAQTTGMLNEAAALDKYTVEPKEIFSLSKKLAINVLNATVMGISSAWAAQDEPPLPGFQTTFIDAVATLLASIPGAFVVPSGILARWPSWAPNSKWMRQVGAAKMEFPRHVSHFFEVERDRSYQADSKANILSHLFQASGRSIQKSAADKRQQPILSELSLAANLFAVTGAGFDTSANSIANVLLLLARYPTWQQWLMEEIAEILPRGQNDNARAEYAAIYPRAVGMQAFFLETLRLFPPLPRIFRDAESPQTIRSTGGALTLPAGTRVHIDVVALHLAPEPWRELNRGSDPAGLGGVQGATGPDELAFRPSRWLGVDGRVFTPPRGAYLAWGTGGRVCPGQKMSQVEMVAFMATLLQRCEVKPAALDDETEVQTFARLDAAMQDCEWAPTMRMREGAGVKLVERASHE